MRKCDAQRAGISPGSCRRTDDTCFWGSLGHCAGRAAGKLTVWVWAMPCGPAVDRALFAAGGRSPIGGGYPVPEAAGLSARLDGGLVCHGAGFAQSMAWLGGR